MTDDEVLGLRVFHILHLTSLGGEDEDDDPEYGGIEDDPPAVRPACELVGHEGAFRLPGGRRTYEAVLYNVATARSGRVRLARIVPTRGGLGLRQINRWVDWDQPIEVLADYDEGHDLDA